MPEPSITEPECLARASAGTVLSRRELIRQAAFFGAAMASVHRLARGQAAGTGNSAPVLPQMARPFDDEARAVKIARAMRAGPSVITRDATVLEMDHLGGVSTVLRKGRNEWICTPGNEDRVGDPPMCVDELGMQWFKDAFTGKPAPTNRAPGLCYMLCGATQHSNDTPFDHSSPPITIGPHWMILWPFDAEHCGLPTTVRDAGAWIMFSRTPYAYLHICGTPWEGSEYSPGDEAQWTLRYVKPVRMRP